MEAAKWYALAANAQRNLAMMYEFGRGVSECPQQAAKRFRKAADQGMALVQFCLGILLESGRGVSQSNIEAAR